MNRLAAATLAFTITTACAEQVVIEKTATSDTYATPDQLDQPIIEPKNHFIDHPLLTPENTEQGGYETPEIELTQRIQKDQFPIRFAVIRCVQHTQGQELSDKEELIDPETEEAIPPCDTKKDQITWL